MDKKQHILHEIRRTAKLNGDVPLGKNRFEKETGIKESDWSGWYWARWGDAVKEAGFAPNTLQPRLDEDMMLRHLVPFVRELGRLPTDAEMRMRKRKDAEFPNRHAYSSRWSRPELVSRLQAFCEGLTGCEDVASICQSLAAPAPEEEEATASNQPQEGFVYLALMKIGREKRFKIGKANIVEARTRQIAITLPEDLELVHYIRTDDPYGIERYWHMRFSDKQRNGEWFALAAADVQTFKRRKFM